MTIYESLRKPQDAVLCLMVLSELPCDLETLEQSKLNINIELAEKPMNQGFDTPYPVPEFAEYVAPSSFDFTDKYTTRVCRTSLRRTDTTVLSS